MHLFSNVYWHEKHPLWSLAQAETLGAVSKESTKAIFPFIGDVVNEKPIKLHPVHKSKTKQRIKIWFITNVYFWIFLLLWMWFFFEHQISFVISYKNLVYFLLESYKISGICNMCTKSNFWPRTPSVNIRNSKVTILENKYCTHMC